MARTELKHFSQVRNKTELELTFSKTYTLDVKNSPPMLGVFELRHELMGKSVSDREWEEARAVYKALLHSHIRDIKIEGRVFSFINSVFGVDSRANLFSNGAGKTLFYELLTMRPHPHFRVSIATTSDPRYDWCRVNGDKVVDVLVRSISGDALLVGGGEGTGLWQMVAAMQEIANITGVWPLGFTVNNTTISVVEAHARRNRVLLYKTNYWVTDLNDVMKFIQYVYSHIHSRDEVLPSFETLSLHDEDQPESQQNTLKVALKSAIVGLLDVVEKID